MPLTVENGAGLPGSDSYVSLVDAEAYVADQGLNWSGTDVEKEAALRRGTAWLDGRYRACLPGVRLNGRAQGLEWPRTGVEDLAGNAVPSDAVPVEIVSAAIEAAVVEAGGTGALSPQATSEKTLTRVGELGWTPNAGAGSAEAVRPILTVVNDILSGLFDVKGAPSGSATSTTAKFVLRA